MKNNNIINKMHIQEPADKLAKTVGKPLKFHMGNREATFFTKTTEYGKLLDNNHNDYLREENAKRILTKSFVQHFNIASPIERGADIFMGAVSDPEQEDANMFDAQEEVQRQRQERAAQTEMARANVGVQIGTSLRSAHAGVQAEIHQAASASSSSSAPQPPSGPPPRRQRTQRARSPGAMIVDPPPVRENQPVGGDEKPPPTPTIPVVLGKWATNAAAQARRKRQAAKDAILKAPEAEDAGDIGDAGDAAMRMDPTHAGQKRGLDNPEVQERIKRAARGDRVVPNFPDIMHRRAVTPAMIEQQLIIQGTFLFER